MKNKLKKLYIKHEELIVYFIGGTCAVIINFTLFNILRFLGLKETVSQIIAVVTAVIFSYISNKIFVFKTKRADFKGLLREILSFMSARAVTILLETGGFPILLYFLNLDPNIIKSILIAVVITLNYIFAKTIVFKKGKKC